MSTKRQLLQQAAALLGTISEKESTLRTVKALVAKLAPGQSVELHGTTVTSQELQDVVKLIAAEIAPIKAQARALQDQALAMKG